MRVDMKRMGGEMVPIWNGGLEDWQDYTDRAGVYCRGVDTWKVGSRIANLIQCLEGKAWDAICNLSENGEYLFSKTYLPTYPSLKDNACLQLSQNSGGDSGNGRNSKQETMRVHIRRCRLRMSSLELSMRTLDNGSQALDKLRRTIAVQRVLIIVPQVLMPLTSPIGVSEPGQFNNPHQHPTLLLGHFRSWASRQRQEDLQPAPREGDDEEGEWERVPQHGGQDSGFA